MSSKSKRTLEKLAAGLAPWAWVLALGLVSAQCGPTPPSPSPDVGVVPDTNPIPDTNEPETDTIEPKTDTAEPDTIVPEDTSPEQCPPSVTCDDGLKCTEDKCAMPGLVCSWELYSYTCLINGVCRDPGESHPSNPCLLCDPVVDPMKWTPLASDSACNDDNACTTNDHCQGNDCVSNDSLVCDDGDACTEDTCNPAKGCEFPPIQSPCCDATTALCDDENPCTTDFCDESTLQCENEPNSAPCDDGDLCTWKDTCSGGSCMGTVKKCDDTTPCTLDLCDPKKGCQYQALDGPACDDGLDCSTDDVCMGGTCVGNTSNCSCLPSFGDAVKATSIQMGNGGHAGEGLDIDQKPSTCAPASGCSGGIDNALGVLSTVVNPAFVEQFQAGIGMLLMEFLNTQSSNSFQLALYGGALDPANTGCNFQQSKCDYLADSDMLDSQTCAPKAALPATLTGNTVQAGSTTSTFPFKSAIDGDTYLEIDVHMVRVNGKVTWLGDQVQTFTGLVGGAIRKDELIAGLVTIPADQMPVDKNIVIGLINFLTADIDTDNDGVKDALSVGLKVHAIDATITGVF